MALTRFSFSDNPGKTLTSEYPMTPTTSKVVIGQTPGNSTQGRGIKILLPKQMLQKPLILLSQVKAGSISGNLLSMIVKIVYSLYQPNQISKMYTIVYSNQYKDECSFN